MNEPIYSSDVIAALTDHLVGQARWDTVASWVDTDIAGALEKLRESNERVALIVHGGDDFEHKFEGDIPISCDWSIVLDILLIERPADRRSADIPAFTDSKDTLLSSLMWCDLGIRGLISVPKSASPFQMFAEGKKEGRAAWQLTIEFRNTIENQ